MSHRHDDTVPPGLGRRLGRRRRGTLQTTRDLGSASRNSGSRGEVSVGSLAGYTIDIYASASPSRGADHAVSTPCPVTVAGDIQVQVLQGGSEWPPGQRRPQVPARLCFKL